MLSYVYGRAPGPPPGSSLASLVSCPPAPKAKAHVTLKCLLDLVLHSRHCRWSPHTRRLSPLICSLSSLI